jgi:hypothetical protein
MNYDLVTEFEVERMTRIELAFSAWEADVLPLNYIRESKALSLPPGSLADGSITPSQLLDPSAQNR